MSVTKEQFEALKVGDEVLIPKYCHYISPIDIEEIWIVNELFTHQHPNYYHVINSRNKEGWYVKRCCIDLPKKQPTHTNKQMDQLKEALENVMRWIR